MSIAGGFHRAIERGAAAGCVAIQIFTGNNQQWKSRPPTPEEARRFRSAARAHRVRPCVSHASYLLNLAAPEAALRQRSRDALVEELRRSAALGLRYVVIHPGAHRGEGMTAGIARIAGSAREALEETGDLDVGLLFENTAGQGSSVGSSMEELGELIELLGGNPRIGVCIDTCHLFAAGYDLRTPDAYQLSMEQVITAVGRSRVRLFHLNDSRAPLGSRVDRHAHIGLGELGSRAFGFLLRDPRFRAIPKILETPKDDDHDVHTLDRRNLGLLRRLARRT